MADDTSIRTARFVPLRFRVAISALVLLGVVLLAAAGYLALRDDAESAQLIGGVIVAIAAAGLALAFLRTGVSVRSEDAKTRITLWPIWSVTFAHSLVESIEAIPVEPIARAWGSRGAPGRPDGRLVAVGGASDAIEFVLRDGRRYSTTLADGAEATEALAERLRQHLELDPR